MGLGQVTMEMVSGWCDYMEAPPTTCTSVTYANFILKCPILNFLELHLHVWHKVDSTKAFQRNSFVECIRKQTYTCFSIWLGKKRPPT